MKEKKLKIIIFSMALAVLALIAVQIYWVANAIEIQHEKFESDVDEALSLVVKKIAKSEAAGLIVNKFAKNDSNLFIWNSDAAFIDSCKRDKIYSIGEPDEDKEENIKIQVLVDTNEQTEESQRVSPGKDFAVKRNFKTVTLQTKADSVISSNWRLVKEVVTELVEIQSSKNAKDFIDGKILDSLITFEFKNNNINTEYKYSIVDNSGDNLFFSDDNNVHSGGKIKWKYKTQLSPGDVLSEPQYLAVTFPAEKKYVLESVSLMLGISAGVIILIIFLFYKTVRLLIRQKKITEIKNDLINNITHEFKTPISTISLAAEALGEPGLTKKQSSIERYSRIISDENTRLRKLVENLLNTASMEKGIYQLNKSPVDIHLLLEKAAKRFRSLENGKKITVNFSLKAGKHILYLDEFHITNSMENLLDNAVKYCGKDPVVEIETENDINFFYLKISDNGLGIEKQHHKKIFETFYRIPTGNIHDVKGNGIGLSYVKKMVEAHGGKIELHSKLGLGSEFKITFPIGTDNEKENTAG